MVYNEVNILFLKEVIMRKFYDYVLPKREGEEPLLYREEIVEVNGKEKFIKCEVRNKQTDALICEVIY